MLPPMTAQNTPVTAPSLIFGAIRDLVSNPGAVLRIGALWFVIYLALSAFAGRVYAHWVLFDVSRVSSGPPSEWYVSLLFLLMLGAVASAWHRFIYLKEAPRFIPGMRLIIIAKYILAWVLVALVIGAIILLCLGLPALLMVALLDVALRDLVAAVLAEEGLGAIMMSAPLIMAAIAFFLVAVVLFLFLLFRLGLGLPSVAVLDGQGLGLGASWRATREMSGAIAAASLWATIVLVILNGMVLGLVPASQATYTAGAEIGYRLATGVVDIITMLVITAILTRIYRSAPPELL